MRYLSTLSLAVIVLMALACTATPAAPAPTADLPKYTDTEVLQVLKDWANSTRRRDYPSWSVGPVSMGPSTELIVALQHLPSRTRF